MRGPLSRAVVAGPPSPEEPLGPLPATVRTRLVARSSTRMRLLSPSENQSDVAVISRPLGRLIRVAVPTSPSPLKPEIGRASCRERVEISVVAVSLKKKKKEKYENIITRAYMEASIDV